MARLLQVSKSAQVPLHYCAIYNVDIPWEYLPITDPNVIVVCHLPLLLSPLPPPFVDFPVKLREPIWAPLLL